MAIVSRNAVPPGIEEVRIQVTATRSRSGIEDGSTRRRERAARRNSRSSAVVLSCAVRHRHRAGEIATGSPARATERATPVPRRALAMIRGATPQPGTGHRLARKPRPQYPRGIDGAPDDFLLGSGSDRLEHDETTAEDSAMVSRSHRPLLQNKVANGGKSLRRTARNASSGSVVPSVPSIRPFRSRRFVSAEQDNQPFAAGVEWRSSGNLRVGSGERRSGSFSRAAG